MAAESVMCDGDSALVPAAARNLARTRRRQPLAITLTLALFALLSLIPAASAAGPFAAGPIAVGDGNSYTLTWSSDDPNKNPDGSAHEKCAGYTYTFGLTATAGPDWKVDSRNPLTPLTLIKHDDSVVVGNVVFKKIKDPEQTVKCDVPFTPTCMKMVDNGHVSIPFTSVIEEKGIETTLNKAIGTKLTIDPVALGKNIRVFLQAQFGTLPPCDESWYAAKINEGINKITTAVEAQTKQYNAAVATKVHAAAVELKAAIDSASPATAIDATYSYHCGCRNPGDPGWGTPAVKVTGLTDVGVLCTIDFSLPLTGEASIVIAGVKFETTIEAHYRIGFGISASASNATITPLDTPTAIASAIPSLTIKPKFAGSYGVGLILGIEVEASYVKDFDRQSGIITATPPPPPK